MSLTTGTRLGSYEILSKLGEGGMGQVYRARDTQLGRDVAIKVLPQMFAADAERLARFEREARTLAALNHPNIAHIYGVESGALVMELVDGSDLSHLVAHGPLPLADALPIARQIAEALEAAHDQGIVHRDLKPANIKVKDDGTVKVLDFGLAKALDANASSATADAMNSPTLTAAVFAQGTQLGVILGTAAYMAPEQAKGKAVDRRADVWAFGCVLYEMLSGRRAFAGDDVSDTLASVLRAEIDWSALPASTPKPLTDLIRRCLERDVRQRLQAIGEARIFLAGPSSASTIGAAAPATTSTISTATSSGSWKRIAIAAIAGAALTVVAMRPWRAASDPAPVRKFLVPTESVPDNVKISPDGRRVLFVAGSKMLIRDLEQLQTREIPGVGAVGTGENAALPSWSPDGQSIAYGAQGKIWRIGVAGGTPTMICDSPGVFRGATWRPDGTVLVSTTRGPIYQVSANGGEPRVFLALDGKDDVDFHDPIVLPDGQTLVYAVHRLQGVDTIEALAHGTRKVLMRLEGKARESPQVLNNPAYSPTGHLLYRLEQGNAGVWAVPFSVDKLETTGEPFIVAAGGTVPSISTDGTLAYAAPGASGPRQLAWFRPDGSVERTIGEPRKLLRLPSLSPDGRRLAFLADDQNTDVWVSNADGSGPIRITITPGNENTPAWLPSQNALSLAFVCPGSGTGSAICTKNADGSGETRTIVNQASDPTVSADGKFLLYSPSGRAARGLFVLDLARSGAKEEEYTKGAETVYPVAILPGNKFALYWSFVSGRPTTMLKPFPTGDGVWEVPGITLEGPQLLPGARAIGFLERRQDGSSALVSVPFETTPTVSFGPRRELFKGLPESVPEGSAFVLSADGTRLLTVMAKNTGPVERGVVVVLNWLAEFEKK